MMVTFSVNEFLCVSTIYFLTHLGEFGIGSLYVMLQSGCEFRDYQLIERHTLLRDVNVLLSSFFISF